MLTFNKWSGDFNLFNLLQRIWEMNTTQTAECRVPQYYGLMIKTLMEIMIDGIAVSIIQAEIILREYVCYKNKHQHLCLGYKY